MADQLVISSDSHVVEPPNLWIDRMDPKFSDRIPHLEKGDPFDQWFCDAHPISTLGAFSAAGKRFSAPQTIDLDGRFDDVPAGGYDPTAHINDLAIDGVYADVLYPSIGLGLFGIPDPVLISNVFSAYNDWLSEFCSAYPDRLKGVAMILAEPSNIETSVAELRRCTEIGLVGAMISVYPSPGMYYDSPSYDPFWAAAQELNMPVSLHVSTNRPGSVEHNIDAGKPSQSGADRSNSDHWVRMSLSHLVLGGVFERFPDLKVINVEHELSWMLYWIQRMDLTYIERTTQTPHRFKNDMLPSDFVRRNIYHSFQEDSIGIQFRDMIGVDNLMWASDYPHAEATFPESQRILSEILEGVPQKERDQIVGGNCARMYGFSFNGS
ncbi:amidohydrolase [SAR202 cluster bacterium AD-804-J14_MRT_500m]|nr:amidohydrolase [SAR202 cluster bacterium AD-804-J14_MRT_500m]